MEGGDAANDENATNSHNDAADGHDTKLLKLVVRSNWEGYLKEFALAVSVWDEMGGNLQDFQQRISEEEGDGDVIRKDWQPKAAGVKWETIGPELLSFDEGSSSALTNFEAKYVECGEPVYELSVCRITARTVL